ADITTLQPGQSIVLVSNRQAFELRYGVAPFVAGEVEGQLGNSDDQIALADSLGNELFFLSYLDEAPWPEAADGDGPSLEIINARLAPNDANNWMVSAALHGTPGTAVLYVLGDFDLSGT